MYENKIALLKENMTEQSECISEDSLYFKVNNNNEYVVNVVFEKKIAERYVQVDYNGISSILELDYNLVNSYKFDISSIMRGYANRLDHTKLFDYIEKDMVIGNTLDDKLYLVMKKDDKYLTYEDYKS